MSAMSFRKQTRLAAFGAIAGALGVLALYALISYIARPTPAGGIDRIEATLTWLSAGVPAAAIIAAHLVYAKILFRESRTGPE